MLIDDYQLKQTRARFDANAERRARNEQLIREGRLLQVDTPERVSKFLARRGITTSPMGPEIAIGLQPETLEPGTRPGEVLERIIGTSDLMGVAFLERGLQVARSVGRVWVSVESGRPEAYGTGFMVSPRLLLTNHHVLGDRQVAAKSLVQFDYALQASGKPWPPVIFEMDPGTFHLADRQLDYALVAVKPTSQEGRRIGEFGWNRLVAEEGKAIAAQFANIIQHPNGEMKQLTLRENRIVDVIPQFLHYTADTLGGSSGSPVYNDRWEVVALHHSGIWKTNAKGEPLTVDNQVWRPEMGEDKIAWLYNEGARVSSLVAHMQQQPLDGPGAALMREMLQRDPTFPTESVSSPPSIVTPPVSPYVAQVQSGVATWTIPLQISMSIGGAPVGQIPDGGVRQIVSPDSSSGKVSPPAPTPPGESDALTAAKQALRRPKVDTPASFRVAKEGLDSKELIRRIDQINIKGFWDISSVATAESATPSERSSSNDFGPKRNLNAWIDDPAPVADKLFHVRVNIGTPTGGEAVSAAFFEPDWRGVDAIDLIVALSGGKCRVEPPWQELKLMRSGNSEMIEFKVTALAAGDHTFTLRVYLAKQMLRLQSLSFSLKVAAGLPAVADAP